MISADAAKVAAVSARRRLALLDAFEESDSGDDIESWWHLSKQTGPLKLGKGFFCR